MANVNQQIQIAINSDVVSECENSMKARDRLAFATHFCFAIGSK